MVLLETKEGGTFKTFENDPQVFSFSASARAHNFSEADVLEKMAAQSNDLMVVLGGMHQAGDEILTSGLFQEAYHEVFQSAR